MTDTKRRRTQHTDDDGPGAPATETPESPMNPPNRSVPTEEWTAPPLPPERDAATDIVRPPVDAHAPPRPDYTKD